MNECLSGGKVALIYYGSVALTFMVRQFSVSKNVHLDLARKPAERVQELIVQVPKK